MGLSDGERTLIMRSAVLTQITRATDRQTELAWHIRATAMLSRVKIIKKRKRKRFINGSEIASALSQCAGIFPSGI